LERPAERAVLLPTSIEGGLAADDQLKIGLSLLQKAAAQVSPPRRAVPAMERELRAVGVTDSIYGSTDWGARPSTPIRLPRPAASV
jgi:hypothetical protein